MEMNYVAPELDIVEVVVEAGFAGSIASGGNFGEPDVKGDEGYDW